MAHVPHVNQPVRDLVAGADRRRRAVRAAARVQRLAPWVAGVAFAAGVTGRLLTGSTWIGLAALAAGAGALAALMWMERRVQPTSDAVAAAVDADAHLGGEL